LRDAITKERHLLKPIIDVAELTIDTSDLGFHDLRDLIKNHLGNAENPGLALLCHNCRWLYRRQASLRLLL